VGIKAKSNAGSFSLWERNWCKGMKLTDNQGNTFFLAILTKTYFLKKTKKKKKKKTKTYYLAYFRCISLDSQKDKSMEKCSKYSWCTTSALPQDKLDDRVHLMGYHYLTSVSTRAHQGTRPINLPLGLEKPIEGKPIVTRACSTV
jgi:hypothetical protein